MSHTREINVQSNCKPENISSSGLEKRLFAKLKSTYLIIHYLHLRFRSILRKNDNINPAHFARIAQLFREALRISKGTCEKLEGYFTRSRRPFCHSYCTRIIGRLEIANGGKRDTSASAGIIGSYRIHIIIVPFANFMSCSDEDF